MLRLGIDQGIVSDCHEMAKTITTSVERELDDFSTVAIERTVARFMGVEGARDEEPLVNILVDHLRAEGGLEQGIALYLANACLCLNESPQEVALEIAAGKLRLSDIPWQGAEECRQKAIELCRGSIERIRNARRTREELLRRLPVPWNPWLYVICATGNIYEDVIQAKMAAAQGADVIAVIRSTGQSLLDYVPEGITTEGYGGTYATQKNFQVMREALDEQSEALGRYIRLVNYCSGLCMPEIAFMGAIERLDMMLNDAMYGVLFRDINPERTLIDQRFSRAINAFAGIIINTGEDNYLTTTDAFNAGPSVLASQFINYHFARHAGLSDEQIGLGHAFQIDPSKENSLLYEIAMALLVREVFPNCPIKYMPPTVHKTGDIFFAHVLDTCFNLVSMLTGQSIHLVGMLTEAIHTPLLQDRYISIRAARYMRNAAKDLRSCLRLDDGVISEHADKVLRGARDILEATAREGLFSAIESGVFAGIKRPRRRGKGYEGVFKKGEWYYNPVEEIIRGDRNSGGGSK